MKAQEKLQELVSSPRVRKENRQFVESRQRSSALQASKKDMVKQLTTLTEEGGDLKGGENKDTHTHKMKLKVKKKIERKETAAKLKGASQTKKKSASLKRVATKLKNNMAKDAAAKAEASKKAAEAAIAIVAGSASSTGSSG